MLSIIIPTLNEEKYLPRLLDSIRQQDFSDYEIIVSDGFSEDNTAKIAVAAGALLVQDKKRSPARQRNAGAAAAHGETILFLDADTVLPAAFLYSAYYEIVNRHQISAGFYFEIDYKKKV